MTSKQRAAAKRAHASKLKAKKQAKRAQNKVEARAASASMHPQAAEDDGTFDADGAGDTSEDVADAGSLVLTEDYRSWDEAQQDAFIDSIVAALRLRCCREGTSPGDATSLYVPAVESSSSNNNKSTGSNRGGGRAGTEAGSWFEGANAINSFFLDDFLFSREARLDLIDRGQLELFFCTKCDRTLQGDSRRKSDEQKLKEERERNKLIDAIKQKHQQARRGENDSAGAATSSSSSSVSQLLSSAIHAVGSSFSLLALSKKVDAPAKNLDPVEDASSLAAEIAAVPPVSAELFPRFNAQPSYCRYCHASSGSIHVRTHMTHSLAMQQSNDMFRELVNPHIRFDEGIGSKAVAAYAAGMKKRKAKANVAAASAAPPTTVSLSSDLLDSSDSALPYAVDIGSRLGNMLYCGVIYSACPRWVGVELDSFFATESARIIRMCGPLMQRVCRVEECDVSLRVSLLRGAKLVCFFNCFELHVTRERHRELLQFLRDSICERGQYVLSCPSLKDIFGRAESTVDLEEWVSLEASKDDAFIYRVNRFVPRSMSSPTPASQKGWGSFQSPSVELLIHQSDAEYRAPSMPAFVDEFPVPDMLIPRKSVASVSSASSVGESPTPLGRASCLSTLFLLDASWIFINHGAFGATLRSMLSVRNAWSEYMEAQPLRFLDREVLPLLVQVTREMAQFVGCARTDLTLHTNATTALNVLFKSFSFKPADKILRLNLAYGAVKKMVADTGATVVEVDIALPLRSKKHLLDAVVAVLDAPEHKGQWKLAVFDHIASNSAIVHPIEELTQLCHARGVPILVDGAHSLGSVPLSLSASGVDYFVSNCHKWLCNPKGAAIMYVAPKWQQTIRPLIISHGTGAGFSSDFIWTGCQDYAPMLTLLSTLRFWNRLGGLPRAMSYNHSLVMRAGRMLAQRWGTELLVGNGDLKDEHDSEAHALSANMVCVRLPGPLDPLHSDEHNSIQNALHFDHRIEVPIKVLGSPARLWMRISAMIYNSIEDYEKVGEVMWKIRGEMNNKANGTSHSADAVTSPSPTVTAVASPVSSIPPTVFCPDHTQVCIPEGADALARARDFYCGLLQMKETVRPLEMVNRPGIWLYCGPETTPPYRANVHVGTEPLPADHYAKSKAHIAYSVRNLRGWEQILRSKGFPVVPGLKIPGMERFDTRDPFGNKVEILEYDQTSMAAANGVPTEAASTSPVMSYFWHTPRAYSSEPLLRVAVFQGRAVPGDLQANVQALHAVLVRASQGRANLVVFPEMWLTGYDISKDLTHSLAITQDGPVMRQIGDWCRTLRVAACFGYPERDEASGAVYNSAALVGEQGALLLSYRKTHLWMGGEKAIFTAGDAPSPVVTLHPHTIRVGVSICYDCEFPEPMRGLALSGAQLVLVPTALARGQVHETVPLVVVPTRALDNHMWVAYSNLVGRSTPDAVFDFCGLSGIIGPDGVALQRLPETIQESTDAVPSAASGTFDLCFADLVPGDYAKRFETTPLLIDRRPELYHHGHVTKHVYA